MEEETVKRRREEEPPVAGWQTIYCSLALILVAFFAMLVSYSSIEEKKVSIFRKGRGIMDEGSAFLSFGTKMMSQKAEEEEREVRVKNAIQALNAYCEKVGLGEGVRMEITERGFRATYANNIFFPSGIAVIRKEAYPSLDNIARIAKEGKFTLRVEGHTDDVPIRSSQFPSNWELSATRAVNVLRYLCEKGGLPAERLFAEGFAQYQPVASNDTPEGRQKNRRVVFDFALVESE